MKKYIILAALALIVAQGFVVYGYARKVVAQVKADQAAVEYQQDIHDWEDAVTPVITYKL